MLKNFTLEYWIDEGWYVGKLKEIPSIFSQGETIEELEENIKEAYYLMITAENPIGFPGTKTKEILLDIA